MIRKKGLFVSVLFSLFWVGGCVRGMPDPDRFLSSSNVNPGDKYYREGIRLYVEQKLDSALICYREAMRHYLQDSTSEKRQIEVYTGMGVIYAIQGQEDSMIRYYQKSLEAAVSSKDTVAIEQAVERMAHLQGNDWQSRIDYLKQMHKKLDIPYSAPAYLQLVVAYFNSDQLDSAKRYASLLLEEKQSLGEVDRLSAYRILIQICKKQENMGEALNYALQINALQSELYQQARVELVAEFGHKYEALTYKRQLEKSEQRRTFYLVVSGFGIAVLFLLFIVVLNIRKKRANAIIQAQQLQIEEYIAQIVQAQKMVFVKEQEAVRNQLRERDLQAYHHYIGELKENLQGQVLLYKGILEISWIYEERTEKRLGLLDRYFTLKSSEIRNLYSNLPNLINICYFGLCEYLRSELKFDADEIEIVSMILLGFTADNICAVRNIKSATFYNKRSNIRKKLSLADKEEDLVDCLNSIAETLMRPK